MQATSQRRSFAPLFVIVFVLISTVVLLRKQGRGWWCACRRPNLWAGNTKSQHNSQHLLDPYSFTHVLHGVAMYHLITWFSPRSAWLWKLAGVIAAESAWEVAENGDAVISRYRERTLALGYEGDSVANSLGDLGCCAAGVLLARRLGVRRSILVFVGTEAVLIVWIKDSLLLNILLLLHPIDAIKRWQMEEGR